MPLSWQLLAVPLLIALNAFFVAAEYALVASRPSQIENLRAQRRRRAANAMAVLKQDPAAAIGAIQVCITLTNLLIGWIGEPAMSALLVWIFGSLIDLLPQALFRTLSAAIAFIIVTLLTVVFSELLPKAMTLKYTETLMWLTAVPMLAIRRLTRPLVWLMNVMANAVTRPLGLGSIDQIEREHYTTEEIRLIAAEAAEAGVLTPRERSLILNSLALGRKHAAQIMVPRVRVAYLDMQRNMEENLAVMGARLFSRLPLCDGGMDHVIGLVYTKEFLTAYQAQADSSVLSLISRPAVFVPESMPLDRLLAVFSEKKTHLVFVVDEHGGVEGIVTLTDVVDELLGEMVEATDAKPEPAAATVALQAGKDSIIVPGDMPLHDLATRLGRETLAGPERVNTVGGLFSARLGRVPRAGEAIEIDGVRLRVLESDLRSVRRVEITPART
jgi:CBS domain containing-hemolysin-like protein